MVDALMDNYLALYTCIFQNYSSRTALIKFGILSEEKKESKAKKYGLKMPKMISIDEKPKIEEMYQQGLRMKDIAKLYNVSTTTIDTYFKITEIKTRNKSEASKTRHKKRWSSIAI